MHKDVFLLYFQVGIYLGCKTVGQGNVVDLCVGHQLTKSPSVLRELCNHLKEKEKKYKIKIIRIKYLSLNTCVALFAIGVFNEKFKIIYNFYYSFCE